MRKFSLLLVTVAMAIALVLVFASTSVARPSSGGVTWACTSQCTINAYQFTGSYVANIYNGFGTRGDFTPPYGYTVDVYMHRNGGTVHKSCAGGSFCFLAFGT